MKKPLPALEAELLLPPVSSDRYCYFENSTDHSFDTGAAEPTLRQAWWLAECSLAAYAEAAAADAIFSSAGLRVAGGSPVLGPRLGGQCYVAADDRVIIVCFRGTQALKSGHLTSRGTFQSMMKAVLRDMATDAKARLAPWSGRAGGRVHQGFAESLGEILPEVEARVKALRLENPALELWLTGHSLGAALATLAADRMENVKGLHTFGSPQVGDAVFADNFRVPGWRFRNHTDMVPWLPGKALGYAHIRGGRYFNRHNLLIEEPATAMLLIDAMAGSPAAIKAGIEALFRGDLAGITPENINDHAPLLYALQTWNAYASS